MDYWMPLHLRISKARSYASVEERKMGIPDHFTATHPQKFIHLQKQSTCLNPALLRSSSLNRAVTGTRTPSSDSLLRSISSWEYPLLSFIR